MATIAYSSRQLSIQLQALTESLLSIELFEDCGGTISLRGAMPVPAGSLAIHCMPSNVRSQDIWPAKHKPQRTSRGAAFLFGFIVLLVKGLWLSSIINTASVEQTTEDISKSVEQKRQSGYDVYHLERLTGGKSAVVNPICSREFLAGMTIHDVGYVGNHQAATIFILPLPLP